MAGRARSILVRFLGDAEDLKKKSKEAEQATDGVGEAGDRVGQKLPGLKGKLGGVFEDLVGRTPGVAQALDLVGLKGDDLAGKLGGGIAQGAALGGAAVAAFVADGVGDLLNMSKEAESLATTMGGGTEAASRWIEVLRPLGVELGDVQDIFGNMAQLVQANDAVFGQLGVTVARNADGTADMNETLIRSVEALGKVKDGATRAAIAQKLFGEQGSRQFTPLIGNSDELRASLDGVADAFVITGEKAKAAAAVREDFKQFSQDARELQLELATAVLPIVQKLTGGIRELKDGLNEVSPSGKTGFGDVAIAAADVTDPLGAAGKAVDLVSASWSDFADSITHGRAEAARAAQQQLDLAAAIDKNRIEHADLAPQMEAVTGAAANMAKASADAAEVELALAGATGPATKELRENAKALDELAAAAKEANARQKDLLDTQAALYTSTLDVDESIDNFQDKLYAVHDAHKAVADAAKEHGKSSREVEEATRAEEDAVRSAQREIAAIAQKASQAAEEQAKLAGKTLTSEEKISAQRAALEELKRKFPEATDAVNDYIRKGIDPVVARSEEARLQIQAQAAAARQAWIDAGRAIPGFESRTRTTGGAVVAGVNIQPGDVSVRQAEPAMGTSVAGGAVTVRLVLEAGSGVVFLSAEAGSKMADALTLHTQRNGTAWLKNLGLTVSG